MQSEENEAIKKAYATKEHRFWCDRHRLRWHNKAHTCGFFTSYKSLTVGWGKLPPHLVWGSTPGSRWQVSIKWWPVNKISFWLWHNRKQVFKVGRWPS